MKLNATIGEKISPADAMRLAIREGEKGAGFVSPNPLVGCTIVDREHRLLAVGYHARVGHDHAEIHALKQISDPSKLLGAHVYVTLEPCAHQGRTPSCAKTLAPLGLASVTYAVEDPNPLVSGQGAAILRDAGVEARLLLEHEGFSQSERESLTQGAEELAEIFLHNQRAKEPFIAVKIASTLDGKIALTNGESKWITGEESRLHAHALRARYDAVVVGRNTVVADDPSLNVRHPDYPFFENRAVVFDPQGRTLATLAQSNLMRVRKPDQVLIVTGPHYVPDTKVAARVLTVPVGASGAFRTEELLAALKSEGLHSLMIEGGAQTVGTFFNTQKVHRLHAYVAPSILGGAKGVAWSSSFGVDVIANRIRLEQSHREVLGDDLYWSARVRF